MFLLNAYSGLYWLTRLDYLQGFFQTIMILGIISTVIICIVTALSHVAYDDEDWKGRNKFFGNIKWIIPTSALFGLLYCLTPTRNEMIVILAGGKAIEYVQSDTSLKKIPYQTTTIISQYLDNAIKELKDDKK